MEYPHGRVDGHHHHHHHQSRRDDDDNSHTIYPPPPQQPHIYPPPPSHHIYPPPPHNIYPPPPQPPHQFYPPPPAHDGSYPPPPPLQHQPSYSSHDDSHHGFHPHIPSFIGSHFHHGSQDHDTGSTHHSYGGGPDNGPHLDLGLVLGQLVNRPTHKIHCKAGGERYSIGIRHGKVVLTHPDHSDLTQHWYKDEKFSTRVKDKDGHPSFMLVNKGTGQAVKHSISCHPVQLAPYKPDVMDESVLWTESKDLGSGFRTIRTVNNVRLVMDAWNADKDHGGIHDGTVIALYETWKGDNQNQQWKLVRHCKINVNCRQCDSRGNSPGGQEQFFISQF